MPEFVHKDFSAGWTPCDSPTNGRPNGLLKMDGIELDQLGDLVMIGGIKTLGTAYSSNAHTIFSKFLNVQHRYVATLDGHIYRDNTSIATGGSATRAAFGYSFDYALAFSGDKRLRDDGTTASNLGQVAPVAAPTLASAGAGLLTGTYEYIQINVFANGSYIAKSKVGPISTITVTAENVNVTGTNVTSPANETWIFRRGGKLDEFYRIKRLTSAYTTLFVDNVTDIDALEANITLNLLALSVNSTDLPDAIFAICGPINQRMLYFTKNTVYFSEINSPESYDPNRGLRYSDNSTGTEVFLWAKEVSENVVQIGTTHKRYILTGTYITLPDGTIDVSLQGIDSKFPPIGLGADIYQGAVCYMSSNGWRLGFNNGISTLLTAGLDKLYRGNSPRDNPTAAGTAVITPGIPIYLYPALGPSSGEIIYDCAVGNDKLYVRMPALTLNDPTLPFNSVGHVYDFQRKYWRTGTPYKLLHAQEDGSIISFDDGDSKIKQIEYQFAKTNDGTSQSISLLFPIWNLGLPKNRKDLYTLKIKAYTGATSLAVVRYSIDDGITTHSLGTLDSTTFKENVFDLLTIDPDGDNPPKTFQLTITGACDDFILSHISLTYDARPEQSTRKIVQRVDYEGLDGKKFKPRTWPLIIDTLGNNVTFTPTINGADQSALIINTSRKALINYFFKTDSAIPLDLGYELSGNLFELYQVLPPSIVQVFPIAKQYDQLGPEHFFRYGKIKALVVRLFSDFTGDISYTIYFQDASKSAGVISVIENVEDSYELNLGKENVGQIIRVVLGPTTYNFYRYYMQIQVTKSGRDTEMEWITLGANNG